MTTENSNTTTKAELCDSLTIMHEHLTMLGSIFAAISEISDNNSVVGGLAQNGKYLTNDWANIADCEIERIEHPERFQS